MEHERPQSADAAGAAMWTLVQRYTGRVGYRGGIKAEGPTANPPVIDCSGWVSLLLSSGMKAVNECGREVFTSSDIASVSSWSDQIIQQIEARTGALLEGNQITSDALPRFATIGLQQGGGDWAKNHPRPRGITHIVQILERPADGARFASEAQGWAQPAGLRLLPLTNWLDITRQYLIPGKSWAVDAFAPISRFGRCPE